MGENRALYREAQHETYKPRDERDSKKKNSGLPSGMRKHFGWPLSLRMLHTTPRQLFRRPVYSN